MQRRLDVAMGLIHRPHVLFLDEPTTGLDPEARADMWQEIERLAREERMTILLTTHYLEEADRLASQLAIVDRGRVVAEGTPTSSSASCSGDTIQVELGDARPPARAARWSASAASRDVTLDGRTLRARAARRRRGDPRRARRARRPRHRGGSVTRGAARRSTTSTCATPGGPSSESDADTEEVAR